MVAITSKNWPKANNVELAAWATSPTKNYMINENPKRLKVIPARIDAVPLKRTSIFCLIVPPVSFI